jgi:hypothetical protein
MSDLLTLRLYLCVLLLCITVVPFFSNLQQIMSVAFQVTTLSMLMLSSLSLLYYPPGVCYVPFNYVIVCSSYNISLGITKFALLMTWLLDLIFVLCLLYSHFSRFTLIQHNTSFNDVALCVLQICCSLFFCVDDVVLLSFLYEFQMIPLLWMLLSRYGIFYNINSTGDSLAISVSKGIGQASYLLLWYGLLSGSLLYIGWYNLFLSLGSTTLYDLTNLLSYQKGLSSSCVYGVVLVFLSGCMKL